MSLVSLRLSWATRTSITTAFLVAVAATAAMVVGFLGALSTRGDTRPVFWCSAVATAVLIVLDFPGAGHARWSEFELSLPVAPRVLARSRLVLSLLFWAAPTLLALGLCVLGVVQPPHGALANVVAAAVSSVLFAVGLRHTFGVDMAGKPALVRALAVVGVIIGAAWPSSLGTLLTLLPASVLLALAHGKARVPLEMSIGHGSESHPVASRQEPVGHALEGQATLEPEGQIEPTKQASFERRSAWYALAGAYAVLQLGTCFIFAFVANSGRAEFGAMFALFAVQAAAYHASYVSRLLRLGHLPFSRERLFRYVAAPSLVALLSGAGLAALVNAADELARVDATPAPFLRPDARLRVPPRYWRFASGEVPVVTAPNGESHRPAARELGLGSALVAYNPYEVARGSSREFLAYQLGRIIAEQRGLELEPELVAERYLRAGSHPLSGDQFPELRDPAQRREWLVGVALFAVGAPVALLFVIRPGPMRRTGKNQRARLSPALGALALAAVLVVLAQVLPSMLSALSVDVGAMTLGPVLAVLAEHVLPVCLVAALASVLLYRNLLERFRHMDPPPQMKVWDDWFRAI